MLQSDIDEIRDLTNRFADYFCEDQKKFVLGDYLKVFHQFCEALSKAKEENENFKKVEARRLAREKKAEEDAARRAAQVKNDLPQSNFPWINEISFRIKNWRLLIISRNLLI